MNRTPSDEDSEVRQAFRRTLGNRCRLPNLNRIDLGAGVGEVPRTEKLQARPMNAMTDTSRDSPNVMTFLPLIPLSILVVGVALNFFMLWACSPMYYSWDGSLSAL
jgi:hypothetical protein